MCYSKDELRAYDRDPAAAINGDAIDAHLSRCPDCRAEVPSLAEVEHGLRDPEVWRNVDSFLARPSQLADALKKKAAMERENAEAARLLTPLLQSPLRFEDACIAGDPRFHTAGTVRLLCSEAHARHDKRPKFSLELADAACAIASALPTADFRTTRLCRARALRERANALRYLGRFTEALKALDEAEPLFEGSPGADPFDRAMVSYIRAVVLVNADRAAEALPIAQSAAETFFDYGEEEREASARLIEAGALYYMGRRSEAVVAFEAVIDIARRLDLTAILAYALHNVGVAYMELGDLDVAEDCYAEAVARYDELDAAAEKVRVEWALGSLAGARGELHRADTLLNRARAELRRAGLRNDHALATLEWVEVRLALSRSDGVVPACREILLQFENEGMMRNARMALAQLHQALAGQRATPDLVRQIRLYLRDLPHQPAVPFAFPD